MEVEQLFEIEWQQFFHDFVAMAPGLIAVVEVIFSVSLDIIT